jgi:L-fucose mutarotase
VLLNIDPILTPALLYALADMGHDDCVAVVDANFTASRLAGNKPVIRLPGLSLGRVCQAVLSVLPLDLELPNPIGFMHVSGQTPQHRNAAQQEVINNLTKTGVPDSQIEAIERFAFYDRVVAAQVIVQTGDLRPYANFLFYKGLVTTMPVGVAHAVT